MLSILFGLLVGNLFSYVTLFMNFLIEQPAIDYYAEVHLSYWNSTIHSICMPITMYGGNIVIPALFNATPKIAKRMRTVVYLFYFAHYLTFNNCIPWIYLFMYYSSYVISNKNYPNMTRKQAIIHGLLYMFGALIIQEGLGHWIGGDDPSRIEGVTNAIIYAPYYSAYHLKQMIIDIFYYTENTLSYSC